MKRLYAGLFLAAVSGGFAMLAARAEASSLYSVYTLAEEPGGFGCGYNTSYSTASGAISASGTPQGGITCTSSINNSSPGGAGATDATSQSQYNLSVISGYFCCDGQEDTATAYANADLGTGQLHLYATDVNNYNDYSTSNSTGGEAIAEMSDTLYFTIAGATNSTVTDIGVTFTYDGTVSNPSGLKNGIGNGTQVEFGGSALWQGAGSCPTPQGFASYEVLECTSSGYILEATYAVTGATATIPFSMGMAMSSGGNDDADFSNTASVTLQLPTGVTYTSASGEFLASETPEPSSGALVVAGLVAVVGLRRRASVARAHGLRS